MMKSRRLKKKSFVTKNSLYKFCLNSMGQTVLLFIFCLFLKSRWSKEFFKKSITSGSVFFVNSYNILSKETKIEGQEQIELLQERSINELKFRLLVLNFRRRFCVVFENYVVRFYLVQYHSKILNTILPPGDNTNKSSTTRNCRQNNIFEKLLKNISSLHKNLFDSIYMSKILRGYIHLKGKRKIQYFFSDWTNKDIDDFFFGV